MSDRGDGIDAVTLGGCGDGEGNDEDGGEGNEEGDGWAKIEMPRSEVGLDGDGG